MSKKVKLVRHISGTRDGVPWPKPGEYLEVPDAEAADLIAIGIAADDTPVEAADADVHNVEKAVANRSVKSEEEAPAKTLDGEATKRAPRARKTEK
jgi:hypothetical protein